MAEASLLQQAQEAAKAREYERALELFNHVSGHASRPTCRAAGMAGFSQRSPARLWPAAGGTGRRSCPVRRQQGCSPPTLAPPRSAAAGG
jgi:hypothetical protein